MTHANQISMADGAGGAATLRFIRTEILSRFSNPALTSLEDSSWISLGTTQIVVTADSYVVDPPIFPGGDIGRLAVAGSVNDLIASGAQPLYLTLSLVIAEGFARDALTIILDSAAQTAAAADVRVVAGDTKVVRWKRDLLLIHASGLGLPIQPDRDYAVSNARVGDKVIVTGTVGDHGFAVLSYREGLGFEQRVQSDCDPLNGLLIPVLKHFEDIRCLRDPTRGGLVNTLVDIAESSQVNVLVRIDDIPIKQEVAFGCEMLGLDPLELVNEGKMVMVVEPSQAPVVVSMLREHPLGSQAAIVGEVQPPEGDTGRLLYEQGGITRVVLRPEGLPVPRLC